MTWQVHVYGSPMPELRKWCSEHNIPLNALYLLRPDTYIALADAAGAPAALARYLIEHQLRLGATVEKTIESSA
jgi:hypothetical protein